MGDDGVGPAAVAELRRRGETDRAELVDAGLAFSEVLCDLSPDRPLVVIDAAQGGRKPGTIYKLTWKDLASEQDEMGAVVSLHEFSLVPALRMEALAGRPFEDVTIFGVEPDRLAWGEGLSPAVTGAMEALVRAVRRHLDEQCSTGALSAG